jgi:carbon monoxide dehydrogenase subunit G
MLHLGGTRDLKPPPAEVAEKLHDARFLVQCVPGAETVKEVDAEYAVCVLRPGFAFVRGTLELTLRAEKAGDLAGRLFLNTRGIGTTSVVAASWSLEPHGGGTRLTWAADVTELGGLLKAVPSGLVQAAAQKVIADAWALAERRLDGQAGPAT